MVPTHFELAVLSGRLEIGLKKKKKNDWSSGKLVRFLTVEFRVGERQRQIRCCD